MNQYSKVSIISSGMLSLLLTACGGGGDKQADAPTEPEPAIPSNRAPQAIAGMSKTVLEQGSVILDARKSNDEDGDALSYQWIQLSGPEVVLSNPNSSQPGFVAPEVDASTELVFELQVSDVNKDISTDTVAITVHNLSTAQQAKQLKVIPENTVLSAQDRKAIDVVFQYKQPEGGVFTAGLMLKLHWDSNQLSFKELNEVLAINHLGVSAVMSDQKNDDHNSDTDKYVILSWLDYENVSWPGEANLAAPLFAVSFDVVEGASGSTHITISDHFNTPGYTLQTQSVSVNL